MRRTSLRFTATLAVIFSLSFAARAYAQVAPPLGAAGPFAVLAGSTVTNTGSSVITGNVGVQPGSAITGFPPGVVLSGTFHAATASALAAQNDTTIAFNNLGGQGCTQDLTGQDLGGLTLTPGVYCFTSSAQLTGILTLNSLGNAGAVFIFKIGSTLTTASNSSVVFINGNVPCNVFWQVGSSATLGTGTQFVGNILALTSITLNTGASNIGRLLARTGAVTLDTNAVNPSACGLTNAACPAISIAPLVLPNGTVTVGYSQQITASGGAAPNTFSVSFGSLPPGLALSSAGLLAGPPNTAGIFAFTVLVNDANACFASIDYSLLITSSVPTLATVTVVCLAIAMVGVGYLRLRRKTVHVRSAGR